ncbi:hypothetical protein EfmJHP10_18820 [Enterococcus faecium]|nr:hypothetical protein EfmJHP10_18820 [Enterococcus faecium]
MTQVHFTFESEEIQAIINESGANDTAKTLMTIMFNQLMEEQRNQYIQANAYERLKSIFKPSELELTRERKEHFLEKYGCDSKLSAACDILENGFEDAIQILSFPENIRRRIRTTNVLERLNEEIRRRERVIRIFPNINSITRIIGTLLMEKDTEWLASPRKYLEFNSNNI